MTQRHPEIIYVRRRVAAVILLLVVVALSIWLMVSLGAKKEPAPAPEPAPNAFTTAIASPTPSATPTVSSPTSSIAPTTTAVAKNSCALQDLIITANADKPNYGPEDRPKFYLTVKNPTAVDCKIDLRKDGLRFEVYDLASNKLMWADTDCNPSEDTSERIFPAGQERHYEAIWSRTTSAPGQCGNRQPVPAGSYFLHTLVGKNNSEAFTFNLG